MTTSRIARVDDLSADDLLQWRHLLRGAAPGGNAFLSPTFVQAAARAYPHAEVCVVERDGRIVAVLPYQFPSAFAASMRAAVRIGEEMNDHFGVVAAPAFHTSPDELLQLARLHYLYFTHLDEDQKRHGLSGEKQVGGLRIMLPDGGAAYWSALEREDAKFARDTERRERKAIQELGPLRFVFDDDAGLTTLLDEKRKQYLRTGKGDWLGMPGRTTLLQRLATSRASECRGVLSSLWFGETWAAMHFGLLSGETLHYWLPVYNSALTSLAPGRLLLRNVILNASAAGIKVIDRGVGETQAKNDFPSERQSFGSGAWHRPGIRSLSYRAYQSAKWRLGEPLARALRGTPKSTAPRGTAP